MADRVKRTYRGRSYTAKSTRRGNKRVKVKAYCRRPPTLVDRINGAMAKAREWGF